MIILGWILINVLMLVNGVKPNSHTFWIVQSIFWVGDSWVNNKNK